MRSCVLDRSVTEPVEGEPLQDGVLHVRELLDQLEVETAGLAHQTVVVPPVTQRPLVPAAEGCGEVLLQLLHVGDRRRRQCTTDDPRSCHGQVLPGVPVGGHAASVRCSASVRVASRIS